VKNQPKITLVYKVSTPVFTKLSTTPNILCHVSTHYYVEIQGGPKKRDHRLTNIILSNLNQFKKKLVKWT